jgi:hypothetical protein
MAHAGEGNAARRGEMIRKWHNADQWEKYGRKWEEIWDIYDRRNLYEELCLN